MGYLYDVVKKALGGDKMGSGHAGVIKDWSPNSIKALIISRDFIFIAHHIKMPKLIPLDPYEMAADLQQNGRTGALHNLLLQRQLSCMEEIYVDPAFKNYCGAMNLDLYISKLKNERSRLRFYGYIQGNVGEELVGAFSKANMNADPMYSYALDRGRTATLSYQRVDNPDWYKNYNLRPQYYALDSEKGNLHRWFVQSEAKIQEEVSGNAEALKEQGIAQALNILVSQDLENMNEVLIYLSLNSYLKTASGDKVFSCVGSGIREATENFKFRVDGLTTRVLNGTISRTGSGLGNLSKAYKYFGIFDTRENTPELDLEMLTEWVKEKRGLLQFTQFLDMVLYETWVVMGNKYPEGKLLLVLEAQKYANDIPTGKFRDALGLGEGVGCELGLMSVLLGVCGWNHESFKQYLMRSKN